jgi:hypothetical protein
MPSKSDHTLLWIGVLALAGSLLLEQPVLWLHPTGLLRGFADGLAVTTIFAQLFRSGRGVCRRRRL